MPSYGPEIFVKNRCSFGPLCLRAVLLLLAAPLLPACAPEIGDACATALDCSASGTRLCDLTQNGGYCTLDGCEEDTCPPESVCVQFGKLIDDVPVDRLSRTFCMYKCKKSNDCRQDEGYACFLADGFGNKQEARVLGPSDQKFCAVEPPTGSDEGMMSMPDAGMMSMPDDDAGN
jgi:hypothetical protein